jgi:hypothetical protein
VKRSHDPRRALVLKLRRRVKVYSHFDVAPDPSDPLVELQTCRACGAVERFKHETTPGMAKKLIQYRADGGVTGSCPTCSRRHAAEKYPLHEVRS